MTAPCFSWRHWQRYTSQLDHDEQNLCFSLSRQHLERIMVFNALWYFFYTFNIIPFHSILYNFSNIASKIYCRYFIHKYFPNKNVISFAIKKLFFFYTKNLFIVEQVIFASYLMDICCRIFFLLFFIDLWLSVWMLISTKFCTCWSLNLWENFGKCLFPRNPYLTNISAYFLSLFRFTATSLLANFCFH